MINLGSRVKDTITGFEGIAVARTEWIHGCVRISVQSEVLSNGKPLELAAFDEPQLIVLLDTKDMSAPAHGPRLDVEQRSAPR